MSALQTSGRSNKTEQVMFLTKSNRGFFSNQVDVTLKLMIRSGHFSNSAENLSMSTCQFQEDPIKIESVKRRLVNTVRHLGHIERLKTLGLPTLEYRRERAELTQGYKIINYIDNVDKCRCFSMTTSSTTRGHSKKLSKIDLDSISGQTPIVIGCKHLEFPDQKCCECIIPISVQVKS